jgi:hypothetical protein
MSVVSSSARLQMYKLEASERTTREFAVFGKALLTTDFKEQESSHNVEAATT